MNNSTDNQGYYLKYGLERDPFPIGIIDKNIYLTPEINRRLKQVRRHIAGDQKLLLITSQNGAGKSLLARKLIVLKEADWQTSLVVADANMESEKLSLSIIRQLMPDQEIEAKLSISMLHKYLETSFKKGTRPVIIIDDADLLSVETLQFILQLADLAYNETMFRIVLFANDSINEKLSKSGLQELAEATVDTLTMPGLLPEQIPAYLKFRFSSCGDDFEPPFTETDIDYLYEASAGLPGGINILARKLMQDALVEQKGGRNIGFVSLIASVFILAVAAYLYYEKPESGTIQGPSPSQVKPVPEAAEVVEQKSMIEKMPEDELTETVRLDESLSLLLSDFVVYREETTESDLPPTKTKEIDPPLSETKEIDPPSSETKEIDPPSSEIKDLSWLSRQPADSYVLQLISAKETDTVQKLVKKFREDLPEFILVEKQNESGADIYLLLYGVYRDIESARAAIPGLKSELQVLKPWPRAVGSVMETLPDSS